MSAASRSTVMADTSVPGAPSGCPGTTTLLLQGGMRVAKERRSGEELRQMMLAAARQHEECEELEDLFIFGPTPRPDANWGFGIAGKENKVSVACYMRLDQIASRLQRKYELHPVKADRRDIEARVW